MAEGAGPCTTAAPGLGPPGQPGEGGRAGAGRPTGRRGPLPAQRPARGDQGAWSPHVTHTEGTREPGLLMSPVLRGPESLVLSRHPPQGDKGVWSLHASRPKGTREPGLLMFTGPEEIREPAPLMPPTPRGPGSPVLSCQLS